MKPRTIATILAAVLILSIMYSLANITNNEILSDGEGADESRGLLNLTNDVRTQNNIGFYMINRNNTLNTGNLVENVTQNNQS